MQLSGTIQSIKDFSNFFDHQLFIHNNNDGKFYSVHNGNVKQIKFPPHLQKILSDMKIFSKTMISGTEKFTLHIFRLGDGHTLFLNDPGTGTVLNGFVLSLITLSSNVCDVNNSPKVNNDDMLDKLVAEFDKEKKKFSVTDKRRKEEIIILEEQAKEAYNQLDEVIRSQKDKDAIIQKLRSQFNELAESYKTMEKKLTDAQFTGDFKIGNEIKKKNSILSDNNKKLVELIKQNTLKLDEIESDIEMNLTDTLQSVGLSEEVQQEIINSIKEVFHTEKQPT